jgi:hypothetical protein
MYDVSVSSYERYTIRGNEDDKESKPRTMYGLPYQIPSMRRRGSVITYCSLWPDGSATVSTACPTCLTMMFPAEKEVFCALWPRSVRPWLGFEMW